MSSNQETNTMHAGEGRDLFFRALLFSLLFAYVGFILAVLCADVLWLGRHDPGTGKSYLYKLATDVEVWEETKAAFWLSVVSAFVTSILALIVAVPAAYALSRFRLPFAKVIDTLIDLPIVIPPPKIAPWGTKIRPPRGVLPVRLCIPSFRACEDDSGSGASC